MSKMNNEPRDKDTHQESREKKLRRKREQMPQHGKNLVKVYINAILKRLRKQGVK
ncbi:hypothetical protein ACFLTP_03050 [Chloroflexota bacterium]